MTAQREFAQLRDWGQFHVPKNVTMALGGEIGELAEVVASAAAGGSRLAQITPELTEEVGDVALYLLLLHDVTGVPPAFDLRVREASANGGERSKPSLEAMCLLMGAVGSVFDILRWERGERVETYSESSRAMLRECLYAITLRFLELCALLDVDPLVAAATKLESNEQRYPIDQSRGTSLKYSELPDSGAGH